VRTLLATAGLLALGGLAASAAAGPPTTHTLRKNASGPIEAVAQDGNLVSWLASSSKTCDAVHVLAPGKPDKTFPQPSSGSMTCRWDLTDGQPQLALAGRMATALWTLHESGPAPFDYVLAARIGGPERVLDRFAHASNGTGDWLGGVAGAGKTLAYSWVDVEYVDKLLCLSGGSCQQKVADGGIRVVTRTPGQPVTSQSLPKAEPALQLAASAGRIAYIPAATVDKEGRPAATGGSQLYVVDGATGDLVSHAWVRGAPFAIALSPHLLAALTRTGHQNRLVWFDVTQGNAVKLGSVAVSHRAAPQLALSDQLIVFRVGRALYSVSTQGVRPRFLTKTASNALGLSLANGLLVWAENRADGTSGRLRGLATG
jgi:hypothetical protein